jgi:hypothetical protein
MSWITVTYWPPSSRGTGESLPEPLASFASTLVECDVPPVFRALAV